MNVELAAEKLARFRIDLQTVVTADVRYASDYEVRELLGIHCRTGQHLAGLVFPCRDPRNDRVLGHRVRLDTPLTDGQKYLSEQGCRALYFAPTQRFVLTDPTVDAIIVEAEKSALALASLAKRANRRWLVIATGGVWGWKRKAGLALTPDGGREPVSGPSPSFDWLIWHKRRVTIALDSNVAGRSDLRKARLELAKMLANRGADVRIASTPKVSGVNGPDDLIAMRGDEETLKMVDRAGKFSGAKLAVVPGVLASEVRPEEIRWLEHNYIPFGTVTIFDGDPGVGKSTVTIDIAARFSRGLPLLGADHATCSRGGVVIVSMEDGVANTIRPRLEAAGAKLEIIRIVSVILDSQGNARTPTIPDDLLAIEAAIKDVKAGLLIIDPLVATLGTGTNSYRDQDVRRALAPLIQLAEKLGVAVICIRHLSKNVGQNPKYRGGGSIGIIGMARAAFLLAPDPETEGLFVFAPVKGNLWSSKPKSLAYSIGGADGKPIVAWHGESTHSAESLSSDAIVREENSAIADAKDFLTDFLTDGPKDANVVIRAAKSAGICERTLNRAKAKLRVKSKMLDKGTKRVWQWHPPDGLKVASAASVATSAQSSETTPVAARVSNKDANSEDLATFKEKAGDLHEADVAEMEMRI
jgi:hypothetical protein